MTIKEAEEFYIKDKEEYILEKREGFVNWFNHTYNDRNSYLTIEGLQTLVDKLIMWYEFKYPNRLFDEGRVIDYRFLDIPNIAGFMDIKQLLYRLSHNEYCVLDCKYRTGSSYCHNNTIYFGINIIKIKL